MENPRWHGSARLSSHALRYAAFRISSTLLRIRSTPSKTFDYTYDNRRQLLTAISPTSGYFSGTYAYGTAGRFTSVNESNANSPGTDIKPRNVSYVYGGSDPEQVTALVNTSGGATFSSYSYDVKGNQVARCMGGPITNCTGLKTEYTYDGANKLRRSVLKLNGVVQTAGEYWYDQDGHRTNVVDRSSSGAVSEMDWFIGDTEAIYNPAGNPTLAYAHIAMVTPVARLARTTAVLPTIEYQFNGLGNNLLGTIAQATGTTNASFSYAPFGEIIEATNGGGRSAGTSVHDRRMNNMIIDKSSNLTYYGYRYFDRYALTWTQSDPKYRFAPDSAWIAPRRAQLYSFDLGNPLRYVDPDGRDITMAGFVSGLGAAAGAVAGGIGAVVTSPITISVAAVGVLAFGAYEVATHSSNGGIAYDRGPNQAIARYGATLIRQMELEQGKSEPIASKSTRFSSDVDAEEITTDTKVNHATGRKTQNPGVDAANDQLQGIESGQGRARSKGVGDATIESTTKSADQLANELRGIKSGADVTAEDDEGGVCEPEQAPEAQ